VIRLLALALRFLAVLFFVRLALRFLAAVVRGASTPKAPAGEIADDLVRDRVCNTFLPRARALYADVQGQRAYFCSESCRERALLQ
jgi:hypothetical protein